MPFAEKTNGARYSPHGPPMASAAGVELEAPRVALGLVDGRGNVLVAPLGLDHGNELRADEEGIVGGAARGRPFGDRHRPALARAGAARVAERLAVHGPAAFTQLPVDDCARACLVKIDGFGGFLGPAEGWRPSPAAASSALPPEGRQAAARGRASRPRLPARAAPRPRALRPRGRPSPPRFRGRARPLRASARASSAALWCSASSARRRSSSSRRGAAASRARAAGTNGPGLKPGCLPKVL